MATEVAERWFERYARETGLDGWQVHEPDLGGPEEGTGRRPDYRVTRDEGSAICEVKEFTTTRIRDRLRPGQAAALSNKEVFGSVRSAVSNAANKQLKPYRFREEPLVVVLANPHGADVSLEDPDEVLWALYGNPAVRGWINPETGTMEQEQSIYARDGVLSGKHEYLSAVVTLHLRPNAADYWDTWAERHRHLWEGIEDTKEAARVLLDARHEEEQKAQVPHGDYLFAHIFETKASAEGLAIPLAPDFFSGPKNKRWVFNRSTGSFDLD